MGCGVRAEGAMRGVGCARLRRAGAGESGAERGSLFICRGSATLLPFKQKP